jgi:hypothetical protein
MIDNKIRFETFFALVTFQSNQVYLFICAINKLDLACLVLKK